MRGLRAIKPTGADLFLIYHEEIVMDTLHLIIVFAAGVVGGSFGTLVGGGGLITIPTLMLLVTPTYRNRDQQNGSIRYGNCRVVWLQ